MKPRILTACLWLIAGLLAFLAWRRWLQHAAAEPALADRAPPAAEAAASAAPAATGGSAGSENFPASFRTRLRERLVQADARPREAVLTFADAEAYARFLQRAQRLGLTVLAQLDALRAVRVRYEALAALEADLREHANDYADATANYFIRVPQPPAKAARAAIDAVPFRNSALAFLGVPADHATWGRGATIAVLDTGVAPDITLDGRIRYLNIGLGTLPGAGGEDGHGTAVAALAAGISTDAPGVAPAASILSIRVTAADGSSDIFTLAQAIIAAVDARAPVINISLGGYQTTSALNAAIDYAVDHGSLIVAAAGNDQAAQLAWPAADARVVSVAAIDAAGRQVAFSNSGPQLQISAPGYGVQTAWLEGQRVYVNGTSASAPLVSGAIAAVLAQTPGLTAAQAWDIVSRTTSDAGAPGVDADYGRGLLNLDWAVNAANPAHVDPAVATHYYDDARHEMDFVVQNRSATAVSGLTLDVDSNGVTVSHRLPDLAAGASWIVAVPVDAATLAAANGLTFTTRLVTPFGVTDVNPANNLLSSHLAAPAP
jgi:hypothetical protein